MMLITQAKQKGGRIEPGDGMCMRSGCFSEGNSFEKYLRHPDFPFLRKGSKIFQNPSPHHTVLNTKKRFPVCPKLS